MGWERIQCLHVSYSRRMPATLAWQQPRRGDACQTGKMAPQLKSLFFLSINSFLPNYGVNYYYYIVKWGIGMSCNWCVSLDIAFIIIFTCHTASSLSVIAADAAFCINARRVPVEGKSSLCLICMKYRIIILVIIIFSLGQILLSYIGNTSRTHARARTNARTHARKHARTHARTHAREHTHTHTHTHTPPSIRYWLALLICAQP